MTSGADAARGVLLDERYHLGDVLGEGGMATVYRAHDVVLDRDVAVKLFPSAGATDEDDALRQRAEMRVLAQLSHPGLVTLHDAGSAPAGGARSQTYLVMELVEGPTLADRLRRGPIPARHTARLGRQIAEALAAVHEADVVHRDIKPANVLLLHSDQDPPVESGAPDAVTTGPIVKLTDFGIARFSDGARLTVTGTTLGTATYLSPEQAAGGAVGPPTDIYALGLVLLECLTGHKAFTGTVMEVAAARLNTSPTIPAELGAEWSALLSRMCRREPDQRLTAAEVALGLAPLAGEVVARVRAGDGIRDDDSASSLDVVAVPGWRATVTRSAPPVISPGTDDRPTDHPPSRHDRDAGVTQPFSPAQIRAGSDEPVTARVGSSVGSDAGSVHRGRARPSSRRGRAMALGGAALVLATGALALMNQDRWTAEPAVPPPYPSVDGSLGAAFEMLQRSVGP